MLLSIGTAQKADSTLRSCSLSKVRKLMVKAL